MEIGNKTEIILRANIQFKRVFLKLTLLPRYIDFTEILFMTISFFSLLSRKFM